jgi:putative membrane protein
MRHLLIRWLVNAVALAVAAFLLPGLRLEQDLGSLLAVAAVFGIVNALVRPILTVLSCPLVVVTLGLFVFVINGLMLLLTGWISRQYGLGFEVEGFWTAVLGGIIVGLVSTAATLVVGTREGRSA